MRPMLLAFVAIAVIAVGANYILANMGYTDQQRTSAGSVRLH